MTAREREEQSEAAQWRLCCSKRDKHLAPSVATGGDRSGTDLAEKGNLAVLLYSLHFCCLFFWGGGGGAGFGGPVLAKYCSSQ